MKKLSIKKIFIPAISIFLLISTLQLTEALNSIESKIYDYILQARIAIRPQTPDNIVIVAIDDKSISKSSEPWPWPRSKYAALLDNLNLAFPRVVAFDVLFTNVMENHGDNLFADAIKRSHNVILASRYIRKNDNQIKIFQPIPALLKAAQNTGIVDIQPDSDSVVRRAWLANVYANQTFFSFSLAILSQYCQTPLSSIDLNASTDSLRLGKYVIPFDQKANIMINYLGKGQTFKTFSLSNIITPGYMEKHLPDFAGKIVLVGATTMELNDLFPTPTELRFPGVEIHANILHSFLTHQYLKNTSLNKIIILFFLLLMLNDWLLFKVNPRSGVFITIVETIGIVSAAILFLTFRSTILPITALILGIWALFITITITRYLLEEKEKNKIKHMFSRYVSNNIIEELLDHKNELVLGGKLQNVTILFSDIKDFTSMSENLAAPQIVHMLNRYFTRMVDIVFANNGTLDKYVGDAIMATFGVPVASPTATLDAIKTACEMQTALDQLNQEFKQENLPEIHIRIGINAGEVVMGNIGSPKRMEFTVIGDQVNIASRLEGINKQYHSKIIISESVYTEVKNQVIAHYLDEVAVKGKSKPIKIYELISLKTT